MCIGSMTLMAQDNKGGARFNPQEFKEKLESYITQWAHMTPAEAQAFFPIYHEMKWKQLDLSNKVTQIKRNMWKNNDDKTCAENINKINELEIQQAKIADQYYRKMCKVVPARKVSRAMMAEDAFHREMLRKASQPQQPAAHRGGGWRPPQQK